MQKHILDKLRWLLRLPVVSFEKHPIWSFLFLLALFVFFAVDWDGENDFSWKEEVQLSTGEIIWVERYAYLEKFGWAGSPSGMEIKQMSLRFFGSDDSYPKEWRYPLAPILLDKDQETKQWFIIATFYRDEGEILKLGLSRPKYWYVRFNYENGLWKPLHVQKSLIAKRLKANLLGRVKYTGERTITIEEKINRLKDQLSGFYCVTDVPDALNLKKYCGSKN